MKDVDKKAGERSKVAEAEPGPSRNAIAQQKMSRAMQLAGSSPAHRKAFDRDPIAYLQGLGVDTRGMAPPPKLSLSTETLRELSAVDDGRHAVSESGDQPTVTTDNPLLTIINTTPPPVPPTSMQLTITTFGASWFC